MVGGREPGRREGEREDSQESEILSGRGEDIGFAIWKSRQIFVGQREGAREKKVKEELRKAVGDACLRVVL